MGFKTFLFWIPYAQGCDLSCTYSNVIVHDRSQPWAYGDVFCTQDPKHISNRGLGAILKKGSDVIMCVLLAVQQQLLGRVREKEQHNQGDALYAPDGDARLPEQEQAGHVEEEREGKPRMKVPA